MLSELRFPVAKQCPYRPESDVGRMQLLISGDQMPELHGLAAKIEDIAATEGGISHEEFTRQVALLLPGGSRARSWWRTGPFAVKVTEWTDHAKAELDERGAAPGN